MGSSTGYASTSLDPLPLEIRNGMIAMGIFGLLSTLSTLGLMGFITYRMVFWKRYYDAPIHKNQVFVLIYNLLLADFQQALSFLFSFHWIAQGKLVGPNGACFAQGWLIQIGDMSSGLWVLAIAVHTFISLVGRKTISFRAFIVAVILLWLFCLFLTAIGPVLSHDDFFIPSGAWCWVNETHEHERLYLHYLWIFISQLGSLAIYITIFFSLRGRLAPTTFSNPSQSSTTSNAPQFKSNGPSTTTTTVISHSNDAFTVSRQRILRTARYMVVYPFAYVALTLPLAAARVSAMAGRSPPLVYFPVAGTLMASCGVVDVILYISTRKALVRSSVGVKGSRREKRENELSRYQSHGNTRIGGNGIRMQNMNGDDAILSGNGTPARKGTIVVSKEIVMSEEERGIGRAVGEREDSVGRSERSDSLRSLVGKSEGIGAKSWLA